MKEISSPSNPLIKQVGQYFKKKAARLADAVMLIEGKKEIHHAIRYGYRIDKLFAAEPDFLDEFEADEKIWVSSEAAQKKIFVRERAGILGWARRPAVQPLPDRPEPRAYFVLDGIEKPGNLGAAARTLKGFGFEDLVLCNTQADPYSPNALRSSLGHILGLEIYQLEESFFDHFFEKKPASLEVHLFDPEGAEDFMAAIESQQTGTHFYVFGEESKGLNTHYWQEAAQKFPELQLDWQKIVCEDQTVDSFNLSICLGIVAHALYRKKI